MPPINILAKPIMMFVNPNITLAKANSILGYGITKLANANVTFGKGIILLANGNSAFGKPTIIITKGNSIIGNNGNRLAKPKNTFGLASV